MSTSPWGSKELDMTEHACVNHPSRSFGQKKKKTRMKIQLEIRDPIPTSLALQLVGCLEEHSLLDLCLPWGFPRGSVVKKFSCDSGNLGLIPELGRSPGEGNDNPLQYSCLENPMDRGAWRAIVHGVTKESYRTEQLNNCFGRICCISHSHFSAS